MTPNQKKALSVGITTAVGALVTYLSKANADGSLPTTAEAWRTLATGAAIAVLASLIHLYQGVPS